MYKQLFDILESTVNKNKTIEEDSLEFSLAYNTMLFINREKTFLSVIHDKINIQKFTFSQLYIPAGRSFFANLKNSIFSFLSESNTVDSFLTNFGVYYEKIKSSARLEILDNRVSEQNTLYKEIKTLNEQILCGKYFQKDGEDYLEAEDNRIIAVANSSSGQ